MQGWQGSLREVDSCFRRNDRGLLLLQGWQGSLREVDSCFRRNDRDDQLE